MVSSDGLEREEVQPALIPVVELGVEEAYHLAHDVFQMADLPPLEAIEFEDWGRDLLLSRLLTLTDAQLASTGLMRDDRIPRSHE